jgi:M6 family metalloprotease-like protein
MSIPYIGKEFTFIQPDGTELKVRGFGNQENAVFETLDGFTITRDPETGFYQYAALSNDGELVPTGYQAERADPKNLGLTKGIRANRTAAALSDLNSDSTRKTRWQTRREIARKEKLAELEAGPADPAAPADIAPQRRTVGDFVGLCLLIDFPDVPGTIPREDVEDFCNQPDFTKFGNNGSVRDYFFDNSGGKLRYTNIVTPYYTAKHNREHYTDENENFPDLAQELIKEALDSLKADGFDFSPLTVDAQGFVYATNIFYAGDNPNHRFRTGLWPHFGIMPHFQLMPGKTVADYQITNMGEELTLGTFCHENGHMVCSFPDLYDFQRNSHGVGAFCLMCNGLDVDQKNPTQINAYLKFQAGWADSVTNITAGLNASVRAGVNDFFILRKNQTEYFIIENRQQTGRDQALRASGLAIWHVDEFGNNDNQAMTPTSHYECSLEQADGEFDFERLEPNQPFGDANDLFHGGGNTRFGDDTNPNSRWWDGTPSGLNITIISDNGSIITFVT